MKKAVVLFLIAGTFIWLRVFLDPFSIITVYVGVINAIALTYVVMDIATQIYTQIKRRIEETNLPKKTQCERLNRAKLVCGIPIVIVVIAGILYIVFWVSGIMNDIISIIALLLSLISDEIIVAFTNKDV